MDMSQSTTSGLNIEDVRSGFCPYNFTIYASFF